MTATPAIGLAHPTVVPTNHERSADASDGPDGS